MTDLRELAEAMFASLELIGDGDWTRRDHLAAACASALLNTLDALDAAREKGRDAFQALVACGDELRRTKAERDELQAALDAADGRTETIRIYEDLFSELGIDTAQPQEAIFEELRRKISALVVAADPSVIQEEPTSAPLAPSGGGNRSDAAPRVETPRKTEHSSDPSVMENR